MSDEELKLKMVRIPLVTLQLIREELDKAWRLASEHLEEPDADVVGFADMLNAIDAACAQNPSEEREE